MVVISSATRVLYRVPVLASGVTPRTLSYPFFQTWGGLIGSAGLEEDNGGADFYAVYYNDHVSMMSAPGT